MLTWLVHQTDPESVLTLAGFSLAMPAWLVSSRWRGSSVSPSARQPGSASSLAAGEGDRGTTRMIAVLRPHAEVKAPGRD